MGRARAWRAWLEEVMAGRGDSRIPSVTLVMKKVDGGAAVIGLIECPHCGRRVSEEQTETAYRLGERVQAYVTDNRWMCDLIEASLRRLGVEAVEPRAKAS